MYLPAHFQTTDLQAVAALMAAHPLATVVAQGPEGLLANHLPLMLEGDLAGDACLKGHLALANPLWRFLEAAPTQEVLVIFQGVEGYISPAWYATKAEHGKVVPTWNYAVVHVWGRVTIHHDAAWLRGMVERLTTHHEQGRPQPWAVADAPADYIEKMLAATKGIEITLTRLEAKFKASQNQPAANQASLVAGLRAEGQVAMADLVEKACGR